MPVYSFRAECSQDVSDLIHLIPEHVKRPGFFTQSVSRINKSQPDMAVEIGMFGVSLKELQALMRLVPDHHVMIQTLRPVPLIANNLERNYSIF